MSSVEKIYDDLLKHNYGSSEEKTMGASLREEDIKKIKERLGYTLTQPKVTTKTTGKKTVSSFYQDYQGKKQAEANSLYDITPQNIQEKLKRAEEEKNTRRNAGVKQYTPVRNVSFSSISPELLEKGKKSTSKAAKIMDETKTTPDWWAKVSAHAIDGGRGDRVDYAPIQDARAVLEVSEKYKDSGLLNEVKDAEQSWAVQPVRAAGANLLAGLTSVSADAAEVLNMLGADKIPILSDITSAIRQGADQAQALAAQYNDGSYGQNLGEIAQVLGAMAPYVVLSWLSGGATVTTAAGKTLTTSRTAQMLAPVLKNPSFWFSTITSMGNKYKQEMDRGASRAMATYNALLTGPTMGLIEQSGGIGSDQQNTQSLWKTMMEEILEEVTQNRASAIIDKGTSNKGLPWWGLDPNKAAVLNPAEDLKTAFITAPVTAIAGGAGRIGNRVINKVSEIVQKKQNNRVTFEDIVNYKPQQKAVVSDGVKYSTASAGDVEVESIKEQIKNNSDKLQKMAPVFDGKVSVQNQGRTLNKEWVLNLLSKFNFKINRDGLGAVIVDKKRVSNSLRYLKTEGELAAYSALPHVIKDGIVIHDRSNHKSRGYGTLTIAAPVAINGIRGNMGVAIRRDESNLYYKVHRILMPDGTSFLYENKKESTAERAGAAETAVTSPADNTSFENSIPQNEGKSNTQIVEDVKKGQVFTIDANGDVIEEQGMGISAGVAENPAISQPATQAEPLYPNGEARQEGVDEGTETGIGTTPVSEADRAQVELLGRRLRRRIVWYNAQTDPENADARGYYANGEIHINEYAKSPARVIFGHEVFHSLPEADRKALTDFIWENSNTETAAFRKYRAEREAVYRKRYAAEGRVFTEADFREEFAAENAETFFNGERFINKLARENRTLAQRVLNVIRDLLARIGDAFKPKSYTGQTSRATELSGLSDEVLRQAERMLERALKGATKENIVQGSDLKLSIETLSDGKKYVQADRQVIYSNDPNSWGQEVTDYINEKIRNHQDLSIPTQDGDDLKITSDTAWKLGDRTGMTDEQFARKMDAATHIDELATISKYDRSKNDKNQKHKNKKFSPKSFDYRSVFFRDFDGEYYSLSLSIGVDSNGKTVYSLGNIQKRRLPTVNGSSGITGAQARQPSNNRIPQKESIVKNNIRQKLRNNTPKFALAESSAAQDGKQRPKFYDSLQEAETVDNGEIKFSSGNNNASNSEKRLAENDASVVEYTQEDKNSIIDPFVTEKEFMHPDDALQLDHVVMQKQVALRQEGKRHTGRQFTYTNDYFVVFNSHRIGEYDLEMAIWVDGNEELINEIRNGGLKDYVDRSSRIPSEMFKNFRNRRGSHHRDYDSGKTTGTYRGLNRLLRGEPRSNGERYFRSDQANSAGRQQVEYIFDAEDDNSKTKRSADGRDLLPDESNSNVRYAMPERSKFYDSLQEAETVLDEVKAGVKEKEADFYYQPIANDATMKKAVAKVDRDLAGASMRFMGLNKAASTDEIATGFVLLKAYQDAGDYEAAVSVAQKLAEIGTEKGRQVQIYSILSRLTPEGMLRYATSELEKVRGLLVETKGKKWLETHGAGLQLTEEEAKWIVDTMNRVQNMEDGRSKTVLLAKIQKLIQKKIPSTVGGQITSLQRISLLLNPKTVITRNGLSNMLMNPIYAVSDFAASGVDRIVAKTTGVRTVTAPNYRQQAKGWKKGLYESFDDFRHGVNTRDIQADRFEVSSKGTPFKGKNKMSKALAFLDRAVGFSLDVGDRPFFEGYFLQSLNGQMKANHVTEPTAEMIEIATQSALEKTWQDDNIITKSAFAIKEALNAGKEFGLGSSTVPFIKTPSNVAKAIVEISPVGFAKGITLDAYRLSKAIKSGTVTAGMQRRFADKVGKGIAGVIIYAIGTALAKAGITSGGDDEDAEARSFKRNVLGVNPYSIKIGEKTYTYDWAQPIGSALAITAELEQNHILEKDMKDVILSALAEGGNTLFEQSMLSGLSQLFGGYDDFVTAVIETVAGTPSQFIPTLSKQVAELIDPYARRTAGEGKIDTALNKVKAKIPGATKSLEPVVDVFGRDVKRYGGNNNWFNVFLNPSNINSAQKTPEAEEIWRLYKQTGDNGVFPKVTPKSVTQNGMKFQLSLKEQTEFQRITGQKAAKDLSRLFASEGYQDATDEEKAEYVKAVIERSQAAGKKQILDKRDILTSGKDKLLSDVQDVKNEFAMWNEVEGSAENRKNASASSSVLSYLNAADKDGKLSNQQVERNFRAYIDGIGDRANTALDRELYRLSEMGAGVDIMGDKVYDLFSFSENGKEYNINIPAKELYQVYTDAERRIRQAMEKVISTAKYKAASAQDKKKLLSKAKTDVRAEIRDGLKARYSAKLDDDFEKLMRMK